MAIKAGWIQAPATSAKEPRKRCCAQCRTPFGMCASNQCGCHVMKTKNGENRE